MTSLFISSVFFNLAKAQEEEKGVQEKILDLVFKTSDLKFQTQDLKGAIRGLEMNETKIEVKIELSGDRLFDFDKWDIRPSAEPMLQRVADVMKQYPNATVLIEGHTGSVGLHIRNITLSQKRADSVKNCLIKKGGIDGKRIATRGWAETKPVAPNKKPDGSDDPEGRHRNRRVEITVKKQ
jgi:outer membrane protein OmpA-like peptidoglycan-associated protein